MNIENIFTQLPTGIFWKDTDSRYLGCNEYTANHAGLTSPEEIIGCTDYDLNWFKNADIYQGSDDKALSGLIGNQLLEPMHTKNGVIIIVTNKTLMHDSKGKLVGIVGNYTEVRDPQIYGQKKPNEKNIPLTIRQTEVVTLLASGMTAKQIANELSISFRTVEHIIENVKEKLRCSTKMELIKKAWSIDFIKARLLLSN